MSLGSHIAMLRKKKGLTQTDLAAQLNAHQSIVNRWERGHVKPRRSTLERLAEVLDVSVEELRDGAGEENEAPAARSEHRTERSEPRRASNNGGGAQRDDRLNE